MLNFTNGDMSSFEELYARHRDPLFRYLLRQVNNHHATAEEVFQEVWSSIITSSKKYQATAKFSTYLYKIAHNRAVDFYRRSSVRLVDPDDCETDDLQGKFVDPSQQSIIDDCMDLLKSLIQSLPFDQRNTFLLRQESNHSLDEIAEITSSTYEATKSRLRYAIKKLRKKLSDEECL